MEKQKMIHIRLDKETYKKLMYACFDVGCSIQKYVEKLIKENIEKNKINSK